LEHINIDERFLGLTLFALAPNVTEFLNAIAFAIHGNIALSLEIGSAYALQVALLQIPALVAFSAFYNYGYPFDMSTTFFLLFPHWDVITVLLSVFILTYTFNEGRTNYFKGATLTLAYVVLIASFAFVPSQ
jgi:Ca2+:H+ antiporter